MRLTDEQRNAVSEQGHLCLVSCPGSGKTRAIVAKVLRCIEDVELTCRRIACITHTHAAADEVDVRLRQLCFGDEGGYYEVATIHAFSLRNILQPYHCLAAELRNGFQIITSDTELFESKVKELVAAFKLKKVGTEAFESLRRAPNGHIYPSRDLPLAVQTEWYSWVDANALVTLDDIVYHSSRIATKNPHVASALASRFAWILVDEFQDSSASQIALLRTIYKFGRTKFFCVGDPNQSIYRFSGAEPELMARFASHISANTSHRLTGNFRSSRNVIKCAERLCASDPPMRAVGKYADWLAEPLHIHTAEFGEGIFSHFLPAVKELKVELGDVAILSPSWIPLFNLARELRAQDVPAVGPGARPYRRNNLLAQFVEAVGAYLESREPEIAVAVQRSVYNLISNFSDHLPHSVFEYRGRILICHLLELARRSRAEHSLATEWIVDCSYKVARILHEMGYIGFESIAKIESEAARLSSDISQREGEQKIKIEDLGIFARPRHCIQLLTIHKSKGREFEAVAVIDCHDGKMPHFTIAGHPDAKEREALFAESRRVAYVAATRAKRVLMFFTDNSHEKNTPSPYISAMKLFLIAVGNLS